MCFLFINGFVFFNIIFGCVYYCFILFIIKNVIYICVIKYFVMYCIKVIVFLKKIMI